MRSLLLSVEFIGHKSAPSDATQNVQCLFVHLFILICHFMHFTHIFIHHIISLHQQKTERHTTFYIVDWQYIFHSFIIAATKHTCWIGSRNFLSEEIISLQTNLNHSEFMMYSFDRNNKSKDLLRFFALFEFIQEIQLQCMGETSLLQVKL